MDYRRDLIQLEFFQAVSSIICSVIKTCSKFDWPQIKWGGGTGQWVGVCERMKSDQVVSRVLAEQFLYFFKFIF